MRKSKQNKMKKCECGCGQLYCVYYKNGKYFGNKSHWKKSRKKVENNEQ